MSSSKRARRGSAKARYISSSNRGDQRPHYPGYKSYSYGQDYDYNNSNNDGLSQIETYAHDRSDPSYKRRSYDSSNYADGKYLKNDTYDFFKSNALYNHDKDHINAFNKDVKDFAQPGIASNNIFENNGNISFKPQEHHSATSSNIESHSKSDQNDNHIEISKNQNVKPSESPSLELHSNSFLEADKLNNDTLARLPKGPKKSRSLPDNHTHEHNENIETTEHINSSKKLLASGLAINTKENDNIDIQNKPIITVNESEQIIAGDSAIGNDVQKEEVIDSEEDGIDNSEIRNQRSESNNEQQINIESETKDAGLGKTESANTTPRIESTTSFDNSRNNNLSHYKYSKKCFFLPPDICQYLNCDLKSISSMKYARLSTLDKFSIYKHPRTTSNQMLNIFKFSHTCTKTLSPNKELYTDRTYSQLCSTYKYQFNWYTDVLPAIEPYLTHKGGIVKLDDEILKSYHDKNSFYETFREKLRNISEFLNYEWSELILSTLFNNAKSKISTNMLIIDRNIGPAEKLKNDLRTLSNIGVNFQFVLNFEDHDFYTVKNLHMVKLFDEIYNRRHPWAQNITHVNIFDWQYCKINESFSRAKYRSDFTFKYYRTAKICDYLNNPMTEIDYVFNGYNSCDLGLKSKINLSYNNTVLRLKIESIHRLMDFLIENGLLPSAHHMNFDFDFKNIILIRGKMAYSTFASYDQTQIYTLSALKYGEINNELYAIEFLVSPENTIWFYDKPIMVFAKHKTLPQKFVKSNLQQMNWILIDEAITLKAQLSYDCKLKIQQS